MLQTIHGIVVRVVRHNDKHNIVTLFTLEGGLQSYISSATQGKAGKVRQARLQPMSEIEAQVNYVASRALQTLGAITGVTPRHNLYFEPVKSAIIFFMSEFLANALRDAGPDPLLYKYLSESLTQLNGLHRGVANFHIAFLTGMLQFVGIRPDLAEMHEGEYFDMREASFGKYPPAHRDYLLPEHQRILKMLDLIRTGNACKFHLSGIDRRRILTGIIHYYSLHLPIPSTMKSLEVLHEVFS